MKNFRAMLGGRQVIIAAEEMRQADDYVSFYTDKRVVALVKLSPGDSIVEGI